VKDRLEWLSAVAGIDLVAHGTPSDADTIRDTAIAQPLIVGAGLVTMLSLFPHPSAAFSQIGAGAGHSVGEITASVGAGVLSAEQAMVFVRERGKGMAAAAAVTATGMSAVLGGDADVVVCRVHLLCACQHIHRPPRLMHSRHQTPDAEQVGRLPLILFGSGERRHNVG
jgi:[acyl-carrier-protein] S-malonyltransferase